MGTLKRNTGSNFRDQYFANPEVVVAPADYAIGTAPRTTGSVRTPGANNANLSLLIADRLALSLINRRQVRGSGFRKTEVGGVAMDDATRKEVLVAYQTRKQEEIQHPFLNERVPFGLIPHLQAMLLARFIRGDLDGYPGFLWK